MHVLIVGAGIGGLTLAQTLRKQGISFEIFERDVDRTARSQGWAIALHTITEKLVASLPSDMPDLKAATNHLAPLNLQPQLCYFYGGSEERFGFEDSPETPFIRAERVRLRDWLLTNLPVQWNKQAVRISQDDSGVSVDFKDGTHAKGDILVGADGINSVVRNCLLQTSGDELLKVAPLSAIVGELTLSGDAFERQLRLGHSAYNLINPELGFIGFVGLHHALPDGKSGRFYWMFMQPDPNTDRPEHWLHTSTQQEKLDHVLKSVAGLPPKLREVFELTPASGVKKEPHIWRDLELESLPAGRVVLMGDAAHAMTPSRGEGAFHAFIDAMKLSAALGQLFTASQASDMVALKAAVNAYHAEMLSRGGTAVRASRSSYQEAQKRAETKQQFTNGLKPLPMNSVVVSPVQA